MDLALFGVNDGYVEAIVRGLRSGFLGPDIYEALKQTQTITDFKTILEDTDYGPYLSTEGPNISISLLRSKLKRKLADEFSYISAQAVNPLSQFIHFMQSQYMIDNIVNIIEGVKNKVDFDYLIAQADPLGMFPELKAVKSVDPDNYGELYSTVLIDTPVGPYFVKFLEDIQEAFNENISLNEIQAIFKDIQPEFIRTSLKKMWLEDFYTFVIEHLNPITQDIMVDLLKFEADCKTIQVVYNSIGNKEMSNAGNRNKRKQLCPSLGYLYPDAERDLINSTSLEQLKESVRHVSTYRDMLREVPDPQKKEDFSAEVKGIDDVMYEEEVKRYSIAFEQQSHYAVFYAYMKLKEQEVRNIVWLAEMVARKLPKSNKGWSKILLPFQY